MRPATAAAAVLVHGGMAAVAQFTQVNCTQNEWSFNSQGQSPCAVWSALSALCTSSPFLVPPLHSPGDKYSPPNGTSNDACHCNVVAFNLASACTLCQSGFTADSLLSETQWQSDCTSYNNTGISQAHPAVNVPAWAFLPDNGAVFQASAAEQLAVSGTINPTTSATASATVSGSTSFAGTTSPQTPAEASHKSSTGPIVGGVVGAIMGLALLALLVFLVIRYRSYVRSKPALSPPREVREREYGMPPDLKIQHFVPPPPSSGHTSVDNLGSGGGTLHPYAAGYAVQRNIPEQSYTSSINYAPHSIIPFDTQENPSGKASPTASQLTPFSHVYTYTAGAHPYASPLVDSEYDRPLPETPLPQQQQPWTGAGTEMPTAMPTRPLPPLRVPQPVRHSSTSTTEFSPSSWGSATPLVQQQQQRQQAQGSIDSVLAPSSHGHSHSQRAKGKAPRPPVPAPNDWTIE